MQNLVLTSFAPAAGAGSSLPALGASGEQAASFDAALARHLPVGGIEVAQLQQAGPATTGAANPAPPDLSASDPGSAAKARARAALDLDAASPVAPEGDAILQSLGRLRQVFDGQQSRVTELMNSPVADTKTLFKLQLEIAGFTVLTDVTSKLVGKSTQALDTLMKGQ